MAHLASTYVARSEYDVSSHPVGHGRAVQAHFAPGAPICPRKDDHLGENRVFVDLFPGMHVCVPGPRMAA